MHEHETLIIFLKKMILQMIQFARNYDEVLLLFKTIMNNQFVCWIFTHPSCNTDNMICPETIKDVYYLKIECTAEAETQWCIGSWPQTSVSKPDSVEQLQKKKDLGLGGFFFWRDSCFFFFGGGMQMWLSFAVELQYAYSLNFGCRVLRVGGIRGFEKTIKSYPPPADLGSCIYCKQY